MIIDLSGKRAIVTGSTAGIGFAIACGLAQSGAAVVINGRSQASVEAATARLAAKLPRAKIEGVAADLATAEGVAALLDRAGEPDILVNNLGIFEPKPFGEITDPDWHRFFDTNVLSAIRRSRHGLPMTAPRALSGAAAESVAGTGVTVNAVLPGPTRWEGVADFFAKLAREQGLSQAEMEQQFIAQHRPTSLLGRLATVEEVANMVVYVCSPQAAATNGAALRVDGGVVRSIA